MSDKNGVRGIERRAQSVTDKPAAAPVEPAEGDQLAARPFVPSPTIWRPIAA